MQQSSICDGEFRKVLGVFATGVTVVSTLDAQGRRLGLTVNSFGSVSLDPPLVQWSLRRGSRSFPAFDAGARFAVSILASDQTEIAARFAGRSEDKFAGLPVVEGRAGLPLIPGAAAFVECRKVAAYPGGDHVVFLGQADRVRSCGRESLVFLNGRYMAAHPLEPKTGPADRVAWTAPRRADIVEDALL